MTLSDEKLAEIDRLLGVGVNKAEISRRVGVCRNSVIDRAKSLLAEASAELDKEAEESEGPQVCKLTVTEKGDDRTVGLNIDRPITTKEELIELTQTDMTLWYIDTWDCTSWNTMHKDAEKNAHLHGMFRVNAKFKRIAPKPFTDALEALFSKAESRAPQYPMYVDRKHAGSPVALVVCLFDAHFGKLAWKPECGEDYDLKIAKSVYLNAVDDLLAETAHLNIERIIFPIGQDGSHVDSKNNTTTSGTVVDTDGRFAKIIETQQEAHILGIDRAMERAPVDLFHVPGNHDFVWSYQLVRTLAAWYRNTDRISVDCSPMSRKYREYGNMLFGFIHGDKINDAQVKSLMSLMLSEQRPTLSQTKFSEWFCGHQHRSRKFEQKSTDTFQGTVVRFVNALSATDSWHFDGLMSGTQHAAEVYIYDKTKGYKGHFVAQPDSET